MRANIQIWIKIFHIVLSEVKITIETVDIYLEFD